MDNLNFLRKVNDMREIVLIKYYNVCFYLAFQRGKDEINKQCLVDCNVVLENFKDIIRYSFKHDMRVEIEKARWDIRKLELPYQSEKIPKNFIVNFSKITQLQIHCAMKRAVLLWIRYLSLSTVQQRVWAMTKFSLYLFEFYPDVQTIYQLDRDIMRKKLLMFLKFVICLKRE